MARTFLQVEPFRSAHRVEARLTDRNGLMDLCQGANVLTFRPASFIMVSMRTTEKTGDLMGPLRNRPYFFDAGLRFSCTRCGGCCTGEPGVVYVSFDEAARIASFLGLPLDVVACRMLDPHKDGFTVREAEDGRCIFYENGCVIYPERPIQCATFPFWFQNVRSPHAWKEAGRRCPGIGRGRLFSKEEIMMLVEASYPVYIKVVDLIYK